MLLKYCTVYIPSHGVLIVSCSCPVLSPSHSGSHSVVVSATACHTRVQDSLTAFGFQISIENMFLLRPFVNMSSYEETPLSIASMIDLRQPGFIFLHMISTSPPLEASPHPLYPAQDRPYLLLNFFIINTCITNSLVFVSTRCYMLSHHFLSSCITRCLISLCPCLTSLSHDFVYRPYLYVSRCHTSLSQALVSLCLDISPRCLMLSHLSQFAFIFHNTTDKETTVPVTLSSDQLLLFVFILHRMACTMANSSKC